MGAVNVLVLTGYGLNCDYETAYAFELAGANAVKVHINSLIDGNTNLEKFQILVFIGGFSWGDDHGAGVIQSVRLKTNIGEQILEFVEKGNLVLGICNGFQTLANLGLLPGLAHNYQKRSVALTFNDCGNFRNQWVTLKVDPDSACIFTRGIDLAELPVRHGEGKFYTDDATLASLRDNFQVALQYALPLMPHPEAYNHWTNHPDWTRRQAQHRRSGDSRPTTHPVGIRFFQNAVDFVSG